MLDCEAWLGLGVGDDVVEVVAIGDTVVVCVVLGESLAEVLLL